MSTALLGLRSESSFKELNSESLLTQLLFLKFKNISDPLLSLSLKAVSRTGAALFQPQVSLILHEFIRPFAAPESAPGAQAQVPTASW